MNQAATPDNHYARLVENTEVGAQLSTPAGRRSALFDMLAKHPDPMWREMGEQLRSSQMRPVDIVAVAAYREHLHKGLEQAKERHEEMFDAIERLATDATGALPETAPSSPTTPDHAATGTRAPARRATAEDDDDLDELPINWVRR